MGQSTVGNPKLHTIYPSAVYMQLRTARFPFVSLPSCKGVYQSHSADLCSHRRYETLLCLPADRNANCPRLKVIEITNSYWRFWRSICLPACVALCCVRSLTLIVVYDIMLFSPTQGFRQNFSCSICVLYEVKMRNKNKRFRLCSRLRRTAILQVLANASEEHTSSIFRIVNVGNVSCQY